LFISISKTWVINDFDKYGFSAYVGDDK